MSMVGIGSTFKNELHEKNKYPPYMGFRRDIRYGFCVEPSY